MVTKHGIKYRGFLLHCDPMPMADGRFGAQVVIATEEGYEHVERSFPALGYFSAEEEAVAYAKEWGKSWVDDHS